MSTNNAIQQTQELINGVDVGQLMNVIGSIEEDTGFAKFQFRASNQWVGGELCRSQIQGFYGGNAEDTTRSQPFTIDSDEPPIASGENRAPNPMEFLLHALASCLTGTMINHASVRGIEIEAVESSYSGDMDVRGLFGLSHEVRKGFSKANVKMRVKSKASAEELTELAMFSPVYDVISNSLPVEFELTTH